MKLNWRDLTVFFPHSQACNKSGGSLTSASVNYWKPIGFACVGVMIASLLSIPVATAQTAVQQQIDHAVERYIHQRLEKQAAEEGWRGLRFTQSSAPQNNINSLTACSQPLTIKDGGENRHWSRQRFSLGCTDGAGWVVGVTTEVTVYASAVIAKRVINRGETFSAGQLALKELDITTAPAGFYSRLDAVTGQGAKRRIRAGQLLTPNVVAAALVIQRGQRITISAKQDGIAASTQGEALENGAVGDVIRVRNLSSKKTIHAKVLEAGIVTSTFKGK